MTINAQSIGHTIDNNPFVLETVMSLANGKDEIVMTPKEKNSGLTAEWVRENLAYEPETGSFFWKKPGFGRTMGKLIGTTIWPGYKVLKLNNVVFYAHRVAWLYVHGRWPTAQIDHIDGNRGNNAIANLREATSSQNGARRRIGTKSRVSPSRGVMPHGAGFVARIHYAGKRHYLGYFSTLKAAKAAYAAKANEIHGEFAHVEAPVDWHAPASAMGMSFEGMN